MFLLIRFLIHDYFFAKTHLHSTMFLLIPMKVCGYQQTEVYLHSTMFLLIPCLAGMAFNLVNLFTFHNVSINSWNTPNLTLVEIYLHSTMFLLIRSSRDTTWCYRSFTFHNVSINSERNKKYITTRFEIYIPQCFY